MKKAELFLGLVGAVGSDLKKFSGVISKQLLKYNYTTEVITLTDIFPKFYNDIKYPNEYDSELDRINSYMDFGNKIRKESRKNDILVRHAMAKISQLREKKIPNTERRAYIFKSLKHYQEVNLLRQIYGESFYLMGLYTPLESRKKNLIKDNPSKKMDNIKAIIKRDEEEEEISYGQKLSRSYQLSDVFIDGNNYKRMERQSRRFIELLFGYPYHTPNPDEHNMFQSYAASLLSSDLSRQVGAIIVDKEGDIIAQGANDVPKAGGGLYDNQSKHDFRDFKKGNDSNEIRKNKIIEEICEDIKSPSFNQRCKFT